MAVCLRFQLPAVLLVLLAAASETCAAASEVSDSDCERATIEKVCEHVGQMSEEVTLSTRKGAFDEGDGTRLNLVCNSRKRMSLNLYSTRTGNIPLNNSGLAGDRGLVISAFGLRHKDRSWFTQTSGMYVILNKCELLKSHPTFRGMLFGDSQITPQLINGTSHPKDVRYARACNSKLADHANAGSRLGAAHSPLPLPMATSRMTPASVERPLLPEEESSEGEDGLPMTGHDPTPWQLSGLYKTQIPNFQCLRDKGFLVGTQVRSPLGIHGGNRDWQAACPSKDALMMVDVLAGAWVPDKPKSEPIVKSTPIINLDSGNGIVYHFIDGPAWKVTDTAFTVSTTPGNSLNVNFPVLTITITIAPNDDEDENEHQHQHQHQHQDKHTMYAQVTFPRFGMMPKYKACKIRDLYDELDIRPRRIPYD
jgi:hypothetical protein